MGYNTTVVVLNDALSFVEEDPDFGKKLVAAIHGAGLPATYRSRDVSAGNHCNAATVVETHHAGTLQAVLVGGNCGIDLGCAGHYNLDLETFDGKKQLLKQLAANLGVKISVGKIS